MIRLMQNDDLKLRLSRSEAEAATFKSLKESLEARLAMLAAEIERLNFKNKAKNDENEKLKGEIERVR